jgi:hypothetical protein
MMHMSEFPWNRWKSNFYKWAWRPGETVEGELLATQVGNIDGKDYPELVLLTAAGEVTLSASQTNLSRQLADAAPVIGDHVRVTYTGEGNRSQPHYNPPKLFEVVVTHPGGGGGSVASPVDPAEVI